MRDPLPDSLCDSTSACHNSAAGLPDWWASSTDAQCTGCRSPSGRAVLSLVALWFRSPTCVFPDVACSAHCQSRVFWPRPGAAFTTTLQAQDTQSGMYFAETGHNLRGSFLNQWNKLGGREAVGVPISEEGFRDGVGIVQSFETITLTSRSRSGSSGRCRRCAPSERLCRVICAGDGIEAGRWLPERCLFLPVLSRNRSQCERSIQCLLGQRRRSLRARNAPE